MIENRDFAGQRHRILPLPWFTLTYREADRGEHGSPAVPAKRRTFGLHRPRKGVHYIAEWVSDDGPGSKVRELNFSRAEVTDIEALRADLTRDRQGVPG